jgi:hypothetical protein
MSTSLKLKRPKATALSGFAPLFRPPDHVYLQSIASWLTAVSMYYPKSGRHLQKFHIEATECGVDKMGVLFKLAFGTPKQYAAILESCQSLSEEDLNDLAENALLRPLTQLAEDLRAARSPYKWLALSVVEVLKTTK